MATNTTETLVSESQQPETKQLKRKSLGDSPSFDKDRDIDAPNKRHKVDGIPGQNHDLEEPTEKNESLANKAGHQEGGDSPNHGVVLDGDSLSPGARRPTEAATNLLSPRQEAQTSHSSRRDTPPHSRPTNQERRPYEARRRDSSPGRSPDHQDRRAYNSRKRDASPYSRERRSSETVRRGSGTDHAPGDNDRTRRPAVSKEEERKRGKRLFGGLLSTLSQTTSNSQQKRRQEIEKRQQEKVAKQKAEDDSRRNERLAKLSRVRKIEQVRFDEQVMRTRHSNMLASARALKTRSEPKLYYRPWELTKEQEDIIKDQIRDAEAQIEEELQQFKRDKEQRLRELGAQPSSLDVDAPADEPVEGDRSSNAAQAESAATATNDRKRSPVPVPSTEDKDHDEMVEAEEDTVIY
ncbi:hypothetical protein N0V82_002879 [Gnomoniopsis sp. IMI 355080]|nr:hypothetical protein N0V82_002879 [Gnomoniopsis sp. IMI 355080]